MSVQLKFVNKNGLFLLDPIDFSLPLAPGTVANTVFGRYSPLCPFQIVGVHLYGTSFTTVTSVDVGIAPTAGGTFASALNAVLTPVNDTEVIGVMSPTVANTITRTTTGQIIVRYTATGTPAAVNAAVTVIIRPRPADGEIL